jgi:hypothetical protein
MLKRENKSKGRPAIPVAEDVSLWTRRSSGESVRFISRSIDKKEALLKVIAR